MGLYPSNRASAPVRDRRQARSRQTDEPSISRIGWSGLMVRYRVIGGLSQLRVLGFGLLICWDVRVGVLPKRQEIIVRSAGFPGASLNLCKQDAENGALCCTKTSGFRCASCIKCGSRRKGYVW